MKLYHFINAHYGLAAIRDKRIKLSTYDDLNDPFELYGAMLGDREIREVFHELKNNLSKTIALLCCSKDWRSSLLWSHYADRHKGIVLEFDVEDQLITHINYRKQRIIIDKSIMEDQKLKPPGQALGSRVMATKSAEWAYEKEARVQFDIRHLDQAKKPFFYPFDEKIRLTGVILGPLCTLNTNKIYSEMPKGTNLTVRKARIAFRTFNVVNQRNFKPLRLSK